ncbi:hypothetical protein FIV07_27950 (plasmid) [Mycobacterium sp. THAF192]|nr:hypothetical protein FIV07_27950 [Mycobacterium sp. THAF192]
MTTMVLQYPPIPGAPTGAPGYGAAPIPPHAPPTPPTPPKGRGPRRLLIAAGATFAALAVAGATFAAGWAAAPDPTTTVRTVEVPGETPPAAIFNDADSAWCREYEATSTRLADAGEASGAPRSLAAPDMPASAWTPEEADANRQAADYLATWNPGMESLRSRVANPALQILMDGSAMASAELVDKIRSGTYMPADRSIWRSLTSNDNAILAICERI